MAIDEQLWERWESLYAEINSIRATWPAYYPRPPHEPFAVSGLFPGYTKEQSERIWGELHETIPENSVWVDLEFKAVITEKRHLYVLLPFTTCYKRRFRKHTVDHYRAVEVTETEGPWEALFTFVMDTYETRLKQADWHPTRALDRAQAQVESVLSTSLLLPQ